MNSAVLLIGTNVGDRRNNLLQACKLLEEKTGIIEVISGIYETEPWGFTDDQWFYNCALILQTNILPEELMLKLLEIEKIMGRKRNHTETYESRKIDIDILFFGSEVIKTEILELPHPRLHLRKFVLLPLVEILPGFVHPLLEKSVKDLLLACEDKSNVINIGNL